MDGQSQRQAAAGRTRGSIRAVGAAVIATVALAVWLT